MTIQGITAQELNTLIVDKEPLLLFDVRNEDELEIGLNRCAVHHTH